MRRWCGDEQRRSGKNLKEKGMLARRVRLLKVIELKTMKEFDKYMSSDRVLCIEWFAQWCGPCRAIAPQFEALSESMQSHYDFLKIDVENDNLGKAVAFARISALPTFTFHLHGQELNERIFSANITYLKRVLEITRTKLPPNYPVR